MNTQTNTAVSEAVSRRKPHIRLKGSSTPASAQEAADARVRLEISRLVAEIDARGPEPVDSDPAPAPAPRVRRTRAEIAATRAAMEAEIRSMAARTEDRPVHNFVLEFRGAGRDAFAQLMVERADGEPTPYGHASIEEEANGDHPFNFDLEGAEAAAAHRARIDRFDAVVARVKDALHARYGVRFELDLRIGYDRAFVKFADAPRRAVTAARVAEQAGS